MCHACRWSSTSVPFARSSFVNHMARHVAPAQAFLKQIVLRIEVIHPPPAFTGAPPCFVFSASG